MPLISKLKSCWSAALHKARAAAPATSGIHEASFDLCIIIERRLQRLSALFEASLAARNRIYGFLLTNRSQKQDQVDQQ